MTNNKKPKIESIWCNLPGNIIISILERLYYIHQIYFLAVCKDWRSKIYGLVRHSDNFPWILAASMEDAFSRKFVSNSNQCYLYDPIHKRKYTIENQILDGAHIHASKFGWLLLSTNIKSTYFFSFYNPFTFDIVDSRLDMMGAFKPGLKEWKAYQCPRVACTVCMDCLIESEDDENLLMLYYGFHDHTWYVYQFDEAKKNWCELENLENRMLFVNPTSTSLQLARSAKEEEEEEENGEGMGSFANTIHVSNSYPPEIDLDRSSLFYKTLDKDQSFSQIYDWIDQEGFRFTWIQPPQMYF